MALDLTGPVCGSHSRQSLCSDGCKIFARHEIFGADEQIPDVGQATKK
jgi:hypothetical protein